MAQAEQKDRAPEGVKAFLMAEINAVEQLYPHLVTTHATDAFKQAIQKATVLPELHQIALEIRKFRLQEDIKRLHYSHPFLTKMLDEFSMVIAHNKRSDELVMISMKFEAIRKWIMANDQIMLMRQSGDNIHIGYLQADYEALLYLIKQVESTTRIDIMAHLNGGLDRHLARVTYMMTPEQQMKFQANLDIQNMSYAHLRYREALGYFAANIMQASPQELEVELRKYELAKRFIAIDDQLSLFQSPFSKDEVANRMIAEQDQVLTALWGKILTANHPQVLAELNEVLNINAQHMMRQVQNQQQRIANIMPIITQYQVLISDLKKLQADPQYAGQQDLINEYIKLLKQHQQKILTADSPAVLRELQANFPTATLDNHLREQIDQKASASHHAPVDDTLAQLKKAHEQFPLLMAKQQTLQDYSNRLIHSLIVLNKLSMRDDLLAVIEHEIKKFQPPYTQAVRAKAKALTALKQQVATGTIVEVEELRKVVSDYQYREMQINRLQEAYNNPSMPKDDAKKLFAIGIAMQAISERGLIDEKNQEALLVARIAYQTQVNKMAIEQPLPVEITVAQHLAMAWTNDSIAKAVTIEDMTVAYELMQAKQAIFNDIAQVVNEHNHTALEKLANDIANAATLDEVNAKGFSRNKESLIDKLDDKSQYLRWEIRRQTQPHTVPNAPSAKIDPSVESSHLTAVSILKLEIQAVNNHHEMKQLITDFRQLEKVAEKLQQFIENNQHQADHMTKKHLDALANEIQQAYIAYRNHPQNAQVLKQNLIHTTFVMADEIAKHSQKHHKGIFSFLARNNTDKIAQGLRNSVSHNQEGFLALLIQYETQLRKELDALHRQGKTGDEKIWFSKNEKQQAVAKIIALLKDPNAVAKENITTKDIAALQDGRLGNHMATHEKYWPKTFQAAKRDAVTRMDQYLDEQLGGETKLRR